MAEKPKQLQTHEQVTEFLDFSAKSPLTDLSEDQGEQGAVRG